VLTGRALKVGESPQHHVAHDAGRHDTFARNVVVVAGEFFQPVGRSLGAVDVHASTMATSARDFQNFELRPEPGDDGHPAPFMPSVSQ
jgi:hypothetical protein